MFKLKISTGNAAFDGGHGESEIVRILREVADKVERGATCGPIHDLNGNRVGKFDRTSR